MIEVVEFVTTTGMSPYANWRTTLDRATRARIAVSILRLAEGNFSAVKGAGAGIYKLRMHFGAGYRVYFGKDGDRLVILLGGGTKRRQQNDVEEAQAAWQEYKRTKKAS